jgi:hypothetical protein
MAQAVGANIDYLVRLPVFINGTPLEQVTSVEMTLESGRSEIFTTTAGLAGFAEGAKKVTVRVTGPVPVDGLESSAWNLCNTGDWVSIQIGVGRQDFAGNGKIMSASVSGSVNQAVENTFEWSGVPADLE